MENGSVHQVIFSFSSEKKMKQSPSVLYKGGDTAESWAREWGNGTCAQLLADAVEKAVHRSWMLMLMLILILMLMPWRRPCTGREC